MPDETQKLRSAVSELHAALDSTHNVDPETRQMLEEALDEIRAALEKAHAAPPGSFPAEADNAAEPLARQLSDVAREFEQTHPTLWGLVGSVIDALARMGI